MPKPRIHKFDVTIPSGTRPSAPLVTPTVMDTLVIDHIRWTFPPGCQGMVGIQIGAREIAILPTNPAFWFVRSGDSAGYDLTEQHDTGDWSVIGYNSGAFNHTIQVEFTAHKLEYVTPVNLVLDGSQYLLTLGES